MSTETNNWIWEQRLAPDFCENIIKTYFKDGAKEVGVTWGAPKEDTTVRKTEICWIDALEPVSLLLLNHGLIANNKAGWHADIEYIEAVQLGKYVDGGHYDWHRDTGLLEGADLTRRRKVSVVVMLTPPDAYEGGDLVLDFKDKGTYTVPRTQGTICAFPSYVRHTVTPVTEGVRYTLAGWCAGPAWK